jgi:hypothetical protein
MHMSWVQGADGAYCGRMAVYVKPNGVFGTLYMAAIKPFRHLLVYPAMIRHVDRRWRSQADPAVPGG